MEESNEDHRVVPELYFLIAKFLSGGPLKETAKTLLKELESVEVLPRRLDWEGVEHTQSYDELAAQYSDLSWRHLARICERALRLARGVRPAEPPADCTAPPAPPTPTALQLATRLSLLSDTLFRPRPKYSIYKQDHSLVRRLILRERGAGGAGCVGGRGGEAMFGARMLRQLTLQRRTLGHLSAVYCLVFSCSGRYVITGADDLLVKVWSALDGRLVGTLRGAGAEITDVCLSGDEALLAAGSVERLVRVWSLVGGAPRAVLHAHQGTITSVHWAPGMRGDVRWLASTSTDGSVAFWACGAGGQFLSQPVHYVERMRPGACHMICAAWSAGGAFLAAGSADHHVRLYALHDQGPRRVLETAVHGDAVDSIAWARRGLRFVSGSKDGTAALWGLHATQWRHTLLRCDPVGANTGTDAKRQTLKVTMVCWDCSDAYVITAVSDNTIRVWCSRSCRQTRVMRGHRDEAYVLEAHPALGGVLLSAGHDGMLFVWDAATGEVISQFHNEIPGQGEGAIFDAKWGGVASIAASDSHGHLLLLGLGKGHPLLSKLPTELFFHTDYRPLVRDALGGALDEQTQTPPHLMPPAFLVDVEGAPHPPELQRLVPGREHLAAAQLVPHRTRLDALVDALQAPPGGGPGGGGGGGGGGGVWRGEGVRHTGGSWQSEDRELQPAARPLVAPLSPAALRTVQERSAEMYELEVSWWRREMRRRPLMISTAGGEGAPVGPRRRGGRRPAHHQKAPQPAAPRVVSRRACSPRRSSGGSGSGSGSGSESASSAGSTRGSDDGSSADLDYLTSSSSSQYSDWEAGPPARARRRPVPAQRYSPVATPSKRSERAGRSEREPERAGRSEPEEAEVRETRAEVGAGQGEPSDAYRVGPWLCAVSPRKSPYHPQMGDLCLYFRTGHQRYFEAVAEKDLYKVNPRDKPWERTHIYECELVKVIGIKYVIKPPRVVCLRLCREPVTSSVTSHTHARERERRSTFTVRYHDMPDVIDFLVLRQHYDAAVARRWGPGDRFRCMIDDGWWTGAVLQSDAGAGGDGDGDGDGDGAAPTSRAQWAGRAHAHFLSLRVRWDNGEVERLSPWDLEPIDPDRLPPEPGGSVPVLAEELERVLYRAEPAEWPPDGDRAAACRTIAERVGEVMTLSVAEPFVAPVDLARYPLYARVVPYPIDLATVRARFHHLFYRRAAAAQFDVRYLASNAEQFNEPHSPIVRQARLVTDLLLHIISAWSEVDVMAKYHELAAAYRSSDDEPLAAAASTTTGPRRGVGDGDGDGEVWRGLCASLLRELSASPDAAPFRAPVSSDQAPDYHSIVSAPMDLGTVGTRLSAGQYQRPAQFAADVRTVFTNSRLYNTNKRSRIYSMTVRLSSLFEALWARLPRHVRQPRGARTDRTRAARNRTNRTRNARTRNRNRSVVSPQVTTRANGDTGTGAGLVWSDSSESETLAATSRRVHGGGGGGRGMGRGGDDSWDSDTPLNAHRKGKGVGKKSKTTSSRPSRPTTGDEPYVPEHNGVSGSESGEDPGLGLGSRSRSSGTDIQVLEEELREDEVELLYDDGDRHTGRQMVRKRRRAVSSGSSGEGEGRRGRRGRTKGRSRNGSRPVKRVRERFPSQWSSGSGSSTSQESCGPGRHYESDRSYRPRYSTDDDAPLHIYRQRQERGDEAGPSRRHEQNHSRSVSLRARGPPRRYNEESEDDSVAAISKRHHHHHRKHHHHHPHAHTHAHAHPHHVGAATRDRLYQRAGETSSASTSGRGSRAVSEVTASTHSARASTSGTSVSVSVSASASASASARARDNDHDYFNGHNHNHPNEGSEGEAGGPVSISSRGRVRRLTAKARGLLRD